MVEVCRGESGGGGDPNESAERSILSRLGRELQRRNPEGADFERRAQVG